MSLFPIIPAQGSLEFPVALAERYRPRLISDFIGLEKPRKIASLLAAQPFESGWTFTGPTGTGKTSLAVALAAAIPAEVHHVPSQECTVQRLKDISDRCQYVPMAGFRFHLILVDEADQMSLAAQLYCLSKLDGTATIPKTIWIFTCNAIDRFEDRFLHRTKLVEFSSYGISTAAADLLARIWQENAPRGAQAPNFARIVKDSCNSVRESLQKLELEIMLAS